MVLDNTLFDHLLLEAAISPRKRSHKLLHHSYDEPVQRLCIALKKGTYVRPHHHTRVKKWELILILKGSVGLTLFDQDGVIVKKLILNAGGAISGMGMDHHTLHTLYPITDEAVIMEVKEGPFTPTQESDFASWSPKEGSVEAQTFLIWIEHATVGERYHTSGQI